MESNFSTAMTKLTVRLRCLIILIIDLHLYRGIKNELVTGT